jgi:3-isopropylmalate dehydrogenase
VTGSAPDIAGKGMVNPVAMILSVSMMLKYSLCLPELASAIDKAVETSIETGTRTKDIGGQATTKEMGDAIAAELVKILKV